MLRNYWLIALRSVQRHKFYSLINVCCLSIGIAVFMTIMLYVLHEHSYDKFHTNSKRIVSVGATLNIGGSVLNTAGISFGTGPAAMRSDAGVESFVRMDV